jgi:hypothetical protein
MIMRRNLLRPLCGGLLAALVLPLAAQTAPAPVTQVPAGSTAAIGPAKGPGPATPGTPQGKLLQGALTKETRKTLQDAMDSGSAGGR